jgi:translation initiation factor 1
MAKRKKSKKRSAAHARREEPRATLGDLMSTGPGDRRSYVPKREKVPPRIVLPTPADVPLDLSAPPKIVLRRERKGRGGKGVVVIEGLNQSPSALQELAGQLKKAMGAGARVEGVDIVVQGSLGERLKAWLEKKGARRVVMGN